MTGITGSFSFGYTSTSQLYHHSSTPKNDHKSQSVNSSWNN